MTPRRLDAAPAFALVLILSLVAVPARSQFATPPASAAQLPWVKAYKSCTEAALIRHFANAPQHDPPPPAELVAQAEHDCADRVPFVGSASAGDALAVQVIVGAEHRDMLAHFAPRTNVVTTSLPPPIPTPTMMSVGKGTTCPRPDYPPAAIRALAQGTSRVTLTVDAEGHVTDGRLIGASGPTREHRLLDNAVVESFRQCRFPKADDSPSRNVTLDYTWKLD